MEVLVATINFKAVSVAHREKFHIDEESVAQAMITLNQQNSVLENVILSTCNRTELYLVVDEISRGRYYVRKYLAALFNMTYDEVAEQVIFLENDAAIAHLFEVSTSLASMIVGETQILGQVKDSFECAREVNTTGVVLNELFKRAITVGKQAQSETLIGEGSVSLSTVAVKLIESQQLDMMHKKELVILGAGKMSVLILDYLKPHFPMEQITIVNRTYENAISLAMKYKTKAAPKEALQQVLSSADVVFSALRSDDYILTQKLLEEQLRYLAIVDLGMPRNADPILDVHPQISRYDMDDIERIADQNKQQREAAMVEVSKMVVEAQESFHKWRLTLKATPVIHELRDKTLTIYETAMAHMERKLPNLSDHELKVIHKLTKSIVNQIIKEPIIKTKELALEEDALDKLAFVEHLFGLQTANDRNEAELCEK